MIENYFYLLVSFVASIIGSISGIGGGIIIKPLLDILNTLNINSINFLSSSTVLAMATTTLLQNSSPRIQLHKRVSSLLAIGGISGGLLGKVIFNNISVAHLQSITIVILISGVLIFNINKKSVTTYKITSSLATITIGLILGGIASFLGIGGGVINIAVLYIFFGMDGKASTINSIFIIFCSQLTNITYTLLQNNLPVIPVSVLILMIFGGVFGGYTGSKISKKLSITHIEKLYITTLLAVIVIALLNIFK